MADLKYDHIVVRYGELSTKGKNRKEFTKMLTHNIKRRLKDYSKLTYNTLHDGLFIKLNDEDYNLIKEDLKQVFGYSYFSGAIRVKKDIDELKKVSLSLTNNHNVHTFKVATKRHDKQFPLRSDEINRAIAGNILHNTDLKVDVHNPDLMVHVEIRPEGTFVYTNEIKGIGGYPVGIQGKGLLMLSGGIDSPVAGYLALKRGVELECLYFESPPHTSLEAKNKVISLANIINEYSGHIKVNVVPFTKIQEAIYKNVPDSYIITIMRRMMYRIAARICQKHNLKVIINGESIGQVASQTLTSMIVINNVTNLPVIRPVACMDKLEIIDIAKQIGTYETSILPYEDCCTIFLPKHPVINPDLNKCIEYEKSFDYEALIEETVNNIEVIENLNNNFDELL